MTGFHTFERSCRAPGAPPASRGPPVRGDSEGGGDLLVDRALPRGGSPRNPAPGLASGAGRLEGAVDHHGDGFATAEAEGGETSGGTPVFQGVEQGGKHPGAAGADGVPQRHRSTIHVHPVPVPAQRSPVGRSEERRVGKECRL